MKIIITKKNTRVCGLVLGLILFGVLDPAFYAVGFYGLGVLYFMFYGKDYR